MQISGLYSTASTYLEEIAREKQQAKESSTAGLFGGEDTVSISQAARERYTAQASRQAGGEDAQQKEQEGGLAQQAGASGGSGMSGTESQIEELEKKLKELQAKLAQVAGNESLSPDEKEAQLTGIQGQIAQVASQLAELKAQAAKSGKA